MDFAVPHFECMTFPHRRVKRKACSQAFTFTDSDQLLTWPAVVVLWCASQDGASGRRAAERKCSLFHQSITPFVLMWIFFWGTESVKYLRRPRRAAHVHTELFSRLKWSYLSAKLCVIILREPMLWLVSLFTGQHDDIMVIHFIPLLLFSVKSVWSGEMKLKFWNSFIFSLCFVFLVTCDAFDGCVKCPQVWNLWRLYEFRLAVCGHGVKAQLEHFKNVKTYKSLSVWTNLRTSDWMVPHADWIGLRCT